MDPSAHGILSRRAGASRYRSPEQIKRRDKGSDPLHKRERRTSYTDAEAGAFRMRSRMLCVRGSRRTPERTTVHPVAHLKNCMIPNEVVKVAARTEEALGRLPRVPDEIADAVPRLRRALADDAAVRAVDVDEVR